MCVLLQHSLCLFFSLSHLFQCCQVSFFHVESCQHRYKLENVALSSFLMAKTPYNQPFLIATSYYSAFFI